MKLYRFQLAGENGSGEVFMTTDVDEPNPQIDAEFWARFMEGDCYMEFAYSFEEDDDE
jgi:hypothetical protein